MTKNLLLFTSDKVLHTGTVSWAFVFQDDFKAFEKFPNHMNGNYFGVFKAWEDDSNLIGFNVFEVENGTYSCSAIKEGDKEGNTIRIERFPEYFYMLCDTATAERLKVALADLDVKIDVLHSEKILTTSN